MGTLIFVLLCVLVLTSPQFSQTQLLRVGNAAGFGMGWSQSFLDITIDKVTINGKEYLKRKLGWACPFSEYRVSYERIEGDSAHYVLALNNQDSLLFNFNWQIGKKFFTTFDGNILNGQRIDSIKTANTFLNTDTVYVLKNFTYNTITGDTIFNVLPEYNYLSKKIGRLDGGMWIYATGVKVNGKRYGEVYPFPEEVVFSADSIYVPTLSDSGSVQIINASDYAVKVDSIISIGSIYGYWGNFSRPGFEYPFYLFQTMPGFMGDTLGIIIPPHDSINVSFFNVDLCPMCDYEVQEYFKDTLRFVFTFLDGNVYSFSNSIPISGEGHPSAVEDDESLPREFALRQNYPNPFNPSTTISWQSPVSSWTTLKIYDILGKEVATLVNEYRNAGNYETELNVAQESIPAITSGVYFYQLKAGSFVGTKKMILLR